MKKLILKLGLFIIPIMIYVLFSVYNDPYNIFHVDNVRLTDTTPDQNFIKTKYLLKNPEKFNALLLGSSRVANLPREGLPEAKEDGTELNWYNMTYAMGTIEDNYYTVKTLLEGGVHLEELIVMADEISMWRNSDTDQDNLIFKSYQQYESSPIKFYYSYIKQKPVWRLVPQIFQNHLGGEDIIAERKLFYSYGVSGKNTDMSLGSSTDEFEAEASYEYTGDDRQIKAMAALRQLCDSNNINLIVLVTPLYEKTYKKAVDNGYLQFLQDLSAEIEFYCFSGINAYTTDAEYYFDPSHFRPYVGLEMEKIVFGSDDEKNQATQKAKSDKSMVEFGKYVNGENVNEVIEGLSREFTE